MRLLFKKLLGHLMRVLTQRVITPTLFNCGSEIPAVGRVTLVYIYIYRRFWQSIVAYI